MEIVNTTNDFENENDNVDNNPIRLFFLNPRRLSVQVDYLSPEKNQLFEEYRDDVNIIVFFIILIRHRVFKMVPDWKKITEIQVF